MGHFLLTGISVYRLRKVLNFINKPTKRQNSFTILYIKKKTDCAECLSL